MKCLQGVILIVVLLFLQVLAVMSLFAMRLTWMEIKSNQNMLQNHSIHDLAEEALDHIEEKLEQVYLKCRIPVTTAADLLTYPLSWWQVETCSGTLSTFKYYYKIEVLGENPCAELQLMSLNVSALTANYLRITLLGKESHSSRIILQSTAVIPMQGILTCAGRKYSVIPGRQSVREINLIEAVA